ncbi:CBS and ACT domain-containing protein [Bacillus sp. AK128]
MIVDEIMKKKVITLSSTDTVRRAKLLMLENDIRHLPVVDDQQQVIGLMTKTDIYQYFLNHSDDADQVLVANVMNTKVITGHPLDFIEEVSAIFYEQKIGCLPIVEGKKLVGIITETDLLHTFVQLTGADQPGSQIEIEVSSISEGLSDVAVVLKELKINILSVVVYPSKQNTKKILVLRVQTMNPLLVIEKLKTLNYHVLWPRIPGVNYE